MFVLSSDITIGSFKFSGVNEVVIKRSMHSIVETATIRIPSIASVIKDGKVEVQSIVIGKQFKEGDAVLIKLGYNGALETEFRGFVSRCNLNMPLEISCEGYSWLLRKNNTSIFYKSIKVKDLLMAAVSGINSSHAIKVKCVTDLELSNVRLTDKSGFDIINNLETLTDGALTCFFISPDTLWCGSVYTPLASGVDPLMIGSVNYRPGYNAIKNNTLTVRNELTDPVEVKFSKKNSGGDLISHASTAFKDANRKYNKVLNNVTDKNAMAVLANEKAYKMNYTGYEGAITGFLQPYATPGYLAGVQDARYPELYGKYLIEGTQVQFGTGGARRVIEVGPRLLSAK